MNNEQKGVNEVDKFFAGLPNEEKVEANIFEDKKESPIPGKEEEQEEDTPSNRRERRFQSKLQAERESNILLAERLRVATEEKKAVQENPDVDPRLIRIFGTGEKETELAKLFTGLLSETKAGAREEALREIASMEESSQAEVAKAEETIDSQLESIEDAYGIDITSNTVQATKARTQFLTLVERLSPKDAEGNITEYADFGTAFELYQEKYADKIDNSRNKNIASRSMTRSSSPSSQKQAITPGFDGWKKDFGLN